MVVVATLEVIHCDLVLHLAVGASHQSVEVVTRSEGYEPQNGQYQ
jgi:hypothetical protein